MILKRRNSVAKFEKVPVAEFAETLDKDRYKKFYTENFKFPQRATPGSCGYDIYSPVTFTLKPGESITLPTFLRCKIKNGYFLMIVPRSGLGFKYRVRLDNTVGIIDSDYYNADNYGHIKAKITNEGSKEMTIEEGTAFCQGIFLKYYLTEDDADYEKKIRRGGFGSTTK